MPRYLVVANLTLGGGALIEVLRDRVEQGSARFHVLVPASSPVEGWQSHDRRTDDTAALDRLDAALDRFRSLGADEVTGVVGNHRPVDAVGDVIRAQVQDPFDEIILSTLPAGPSKWLSMDLPSRVERTHRIPLTHVTARLGEPLQT